MTRFGLRSSLGMAQILHLSQILFNVDADTTLVLCSARHHADPLSHCATHRQWMVLTAEGWILRILSETVLKLLGKHLRCTVPSLFLLRLAFYLICCRSLFWGQFTTKIRRPNGCGESCSGVNSSVSARLKPADDVACRHVNCLRPVLGRKARQLFQQPVSLLRSPVAKAVFRPTQVIQQKCRFSPLFSSKWGLSV